MPSSWPALPLLHPLTIPLQHPPLFYIILLGKRFILICTRHLHRISGVGIFCLVLSLIVESKILSPQERRASMGKPGRWIYNIACHVTSGCWVLPVQKTFTARSFSRAGRYPHDPKEQSFPTDGPILNLLLRHQQCSWLPEASATHSCKQKCPEIRDLRCA